MTASTLNSKSEGQRKRCDLLMAGEDEIGRERIKHPLRLSLRRPCCDAMCDGEQGCEESVPPRT